MAKTHTLSFRLNDDDYQAFLCAYEKFVLDEFEKWQDTDHPWDYEKPDRTQFFLDMIYTYGRKVFYATRE